MLHGARHSQTVREKSTHNLLPTMKKIQTFPACFGWLAALAAAVLPVHAETMTFTATDDATILNGSLANHNYGNFSPISSGTVGNTVTGQRSILRFDVGALDGLYTSIDSVTLRLYYADDSSTGSGTAMVTTDVHAITAANRAWIEGTSAGAAQSGESTWNNLAHSATPWAGTAGLGTAGTDYDSVVLASHTIDLSNRPAPGTAIDFTFTGSSAALTALIDAWMVDNVDNSQANPGLLLRDPTPTVNTKRNRFTASSTEDPNAALHPQLIVEYSTSTSTSDFSVIITPNAGTPGNYDFQWNSQPGKVYDLVSATDLATPASTWAVWQGHSGIPADELDGINELTNVPGGGDTRRFFAVRESAAAP